MVIYAIKHKKTGNMYIGQTIQNSKKRWNSHRSMLRNNHHQNQHLQSAWNKYGKDAFVFEVLDETAENLDQLNALEIFYVATVGYEETKIKMSESAKGRVPWNKGTSRPRVEFK